MAGEQLPALAQQIAVIEQQIGTPTYWRDEGLQQRYRSLLDARDAGGPVPASPSAAAREIAEIERTMRTDARRYFRDQAMQARYRALIAGRDGVADAIVPEAAGRWLVQPETWRQGLPAGVADEWQEQPGGFEASLGRLQGAIVAIVQGIGEDGAARQFLESFAGLPELARASVLREVGRPEPGYTKPADDDDMARFRQLCGGPDMIRAWGRSARHHVAVANDRFRRAYSAMSASDRSAFGRWLRTITPRAHMCFVWALGSAR